MGAHWMPQGPLAETTKWHRPSPSLLQSQRTLKYKIEKSN